VTIACGGISGLHGLVASGTTSKQQNSEPDARFVGYLGSVGEGSLALVTIIATTAGFHPSVSGKRCTRRLVRAASPHSSSGAGDIFATLGVPVAFAQTLLTVAAVLFAWTTMDASVRLQRYIVKEWGAIYRIPLMQNGYVATLTAVAACLALAFGAGGAEGTDGMDIWLLFGTTNQLSSLDSSCLSGCFSRPPDVAINRRQGA
jgi:carbon starvation protein